MFPLLTIKNGRAIIRKSVEAAEDEDAMEFNADNLNNDNYEE